MKGNSKTICIILFIIADALLVLWNFQLLGGLGAFTIDKNINILSFISLIVTICIAIFVPFLIKKAIDDNRGIKTLLIEELKSLISILEENHKLISKLFSEESEIENKDRDFVLEKFFDGELKLDSLKLQLEVSYSSKEKFRKKIFENTMEYKRFLTDGKFMKSTYKKIDYDFYREEKNAFAQFQKMIITQMHEIHKF